MYAKKIMRVLTYKFSSWNRRRKLRFILNFINDNGIRSCLLVGATPDATGNGFANLIERGLNSRFQNITASGLEPSAIGWSNWVQADGCNLPFPSKSFDLVFSNAVIEHVGDKQAQLRFIQEHDRVGSSFILTTPNRLFPIESHTQVLFKHMRKSWNSTLVSRLLSKGDLIEILPATSSVKGTIFSPTFIAYKNKS